MVLKITKVLLRKATKHLKKAPKQQHSTVQMPSLCLYIGARQRFGELIATSNWKK